MIKVCSTCEKRTPKEPLELEVETHGFCSKNQTNCIAIYLAWNAAGCPGTLPEFAKTYEEVVHDVVLQKVQL